MRRSLNTLPAVAVLLTALPATATQIWHDVNGYTSTPSGLVRFSVLVADDAGKVLETGDDSLLASYPDATRHNGGGRTLLPGFIDNHVHFALPGPTIPAHETQNTWEDMAVNAITMAEM